MLEIELSNTDINYDELNGIKITEINVHQTLCNLFKNSLNYSKSINNNYLPNTIIVH